MIEILENNHLVSYINTTKKKISIKHYLNTYLFPVGINKNNEDLYPLYYRIIFNRQSVKIKSNIKKPFAPIEFKKDSLTDDDITLMEREALTLSYVVDKIFNDQKKEKRNPVFSFFSEYNQEITEEKVEQEFDINELFNDFDYKDYELPAIIEKALLTKIEEFSKLQSEESLLSDIQKYSERLNPYQLVQFLKSQNKKWSTFEKQFHPEIWFFNLHYYHFVANTKKYQDLGASIIDLIYMDFQAYFSDFCYDHKLNKLEDEVQRLLLPKKR